MSKMLPNKSLHPPPDASVTALAFATAAPDTGAGQLKRQMARNFAENLSPAAWLAPLFAPIGAVPMFLQFNTRNSTQHFDLVLGTVLVAYLFVALIVLPVFLLTRARVLWTAGRVIAFGIGLAISPLVVSFGWQFLKALLRGTQNEYFLATLKQDWTVFWSFLLCGLVVALAFVVMQRSNRAGAI